MSETGHESAAGRRKGFPRLGAVLGVILGAGGGFTEAIIGGVLGAGIGNSIKREKN